MKKKDLSKKTKFKKFAMASSPIQAADVFHSKISLHPLQQTYSSIETFLQLIKTTIGPYGKLKMVQNSIGGHVTVTSIASRLFCAASVNSFILKIILASVKSHLLRFNDGGLYCCLLILCVIKNSINLPTPIGLNGELQHYFGLRFLKNLGDLKKNFYFQADLSLSNLRSIVYSILNSKLYCLLTFEEKQNLSLLLLKTFLNAIPTEQFKGVRTSANITYYALLGLSPDQSASIDGLLLNIPEMLRSKNILFHSQARNVLVAVFGVSLAGDAEFSSKEVQARDISIWQEVLTRLRVICQKLISDGVQIVFCQKVIHPTMHKHLEDNGILAIDRLGFEMTHNLEQVSGALSIMSLSDTMRMTYGILDRAEVKEIGGTRFLLVQNEAHPFWTIQISNYNEEALNETKAVCQQVMHTLFRLLHEPMVCSGGGCTEIAVAHSVKQEILKDISQLSKKHSCSVSAVLESLQAFLTSVYDVALSINQGTHLEFMSERVHHHLWKQDVASSSNATCQCGKYKVDEICANQWYFLSRSDMYTGTPQPEITEVESSFEIPNVLDPLDMKMNACSVAFETAYSLLQVSLCVTSDQ